jgi:hypothetical protein
LDFLWGNFFKAFLSDDGSAFFALVLLCFLVLHWEEYGMEGGENRDWYINSIHVRFLLALASPSRCDHSCACYWFS